MHKKQVKAVIFDFDGTLVNTEELSIKSYQHAAEQFQILHDFNFKLIAGLHQHAAQNKLKQVTSIPNGFFDEAMAYFSDLITTKLHPFDGVLDTLASLKAKHIPIAIASNSHLEYVLNLSKSAQIAHYITCFSCHNQQLKAKPQPDVFLDAFSQLKQHNPLLQKQEIIIIEDSIIGIQAAKQAGIFTFGITNTYPKDSLLDAGADCIIDKIDKILPFIECLKH